MKLFLLAFLSSWLLLLFGTIATSTNAYEPTALFELWPFYLASLVFFSLLLVMWRGNLFPLALLSAFYMASVAALPYIKYPLLYGTDGDNMFHYALTQTILTTGHIPVTNPYYGFSTFHSLAAIISMTTSLPLIVAFKLETFVLPALVSLSGFWVAIDVLRKRSTIKLAILGTIIAFAPNYISQPQVMAGFFVVLSFALVLQFAKTGVNPPSQSYMVALLLLTFATIITHHQTAFFTIFAFVGIGLLVPALRRTLRTNTAVGPRMELVGLLALGFAYIWWTYYAGFTDFIRNVFSIITGEPIQFQTTVGRGVSYYGPLEWTFRTIVNYAQRGQLLVWTTVGITVTGASLVLRRKLDTVDLDTHAIVLGCILLYLGIYTVFLFVPYFVIGGERFFRFISFVSPPFIAIGIETVYSLIRRGGTILNFKIGALMRAKPFQAAMVFALICLVFVELISPFLLGGVYHASSQFQSDQIIFIGGHATNSTKIISHVIIINQIQVYAPLFPLTTTLLKVNSPELLFALDATHQLPSYAYGSLIIFQRVGPAGAYFEPANYYSNATWVTPAVTRLLELGRTSMLYNNGEAFIAYEA